MADKLPRGVLRASLRALEASGAWISAAEEAKVRMALEVALPLIERDVRRKMAQHLMALRDAEQGSMSHSSWRRCLRRISRGEPLPDLGDVTATPESDHPS